jgi:hypothetical protein
LRGVFIFNENFSCKTRKAIVHANVSDVCILYKNNTMPNKHIEWLVNFPTKGYIFTRLTKRYPSGFYEREKSDGTKPVFSEEETAGMSLDYLRIEYIMHEQKCSLIAGKATEKVAPQKYNPGFLEFDSLDNNQLPDEETRKNILAALSFAFGRQLSLVGSTSLSQNGDRIRLTVRNTDLFDNNAYVQCSLPPTPVTTDDSERLLDESKISRIISAVVTQMESINIRSSLSFVWTGFASPLDVQAAHIGAAIESLRDSYCKFYKNKLSTQLVDKKIWKKRLKEPLLTTFDKVINNIDKIDGDEKSLEILRKKLENINYKSSNMQYDEFFSVLSLPVGEVEKAALQERNKPAHGHFYQDSDYQKLSMTIKALYSLFNRLVIKMTDASDYYIDYSTYGYPVRPIDEPLGGPEGDGKPAFPKN